MKKLLALILGSILSLSLVACGNSKETTEQQNKEKEVVKYTITEEQKEQVKQIFKSNVTDTPYEEAKLDVSVDEYNNIHMKVAVDSDELAKLYIKLGMMNEFNYDQLLDAMNQTSTFDEIPGELSKLGFNKQLDLDFYHLQDEGFKGDSFKYLSIEE